MTRETPLYSVTGFVLGHLLAAYLKAFGYKRCSEFYRGCGCCSLYIARDQLLAYGSDPEWLGEES